jgi:magnesium transporter
MIDIQIFFQETKQLKRTSNIEEIRGVIDDPSVTIWVDLEEPTIEEDSLLGDVFGFHPLTIEDARETRNHPKIELYPGYLFFIVHGVKTETNSYNFVTKELDGFLGPNYVVTYHMEKFSSIDNVKLLVENSPMLMEKGADHLLHQILDRVVDLYIPVVEDFQEEIGELEDRIVAMTGHNGEILSEVMDLKRSVGRLIRISSKQSAVLYRLAHGEFSLIGDHQLPFFRDVYDHLQRAALLAENYRDLVNGLMDIHFSVTATKTNEVMKLLAIFSAIMLPLSVIAGIYGMNVRLPDAENGDAFWHVIIGMGLFVIILLGYFFRKGWILPNVWKRNIETSRRLSSKSDRLEDEGDY